MSLTNSLIEMGALELLRKNLLFGPNERHFQQAEQAWKALSFWQKIKSKKKFIRKKAWSIYQDERAMHSAIGTTITIRKPPRYETK